MKYADVIVDISSSQVDRTFQYRIPEELQDVLTVGSQVRVPFGRRSVSGIVVGTGDKAEVDESRMKEIGGLAPGTLSADMHLIRLAVWMKDTYGCTMNQALKTVLPVRRKVRKGKRKVEQTAVPEGERDVPPVLNPEQQAAVDGVWEEIHREGARPCLIYGVTGSGKTEVYMSLIARTIAEGKQAILLIPEISLTYQNLRRFYRRFGDRVAVINSRLSEGEKYECVEKARTGAADLVIGPRSALFVPFPRLGLILVDEEHETSYHSDYTPRYRAVETAIARAAIEGAGVVLGSATPSMETFSAAMDRKYAIFTIRHRAAPGSMLPKVNLVDMREELRSGNKSIFSRLLSEQIRERLERKEQVILFLNRRGYSGFIACRSCGKVMKCPHCDVSLTSHQGGSLVCHYCGYTIPMPQVCPDCGSPYIAGFGMGTQKVENQAKKLFPGARTLRMDLDTTAAKDGHSRILKAFAGGEADILIGTQMIVKGHDFPKVTLVGILAADLSLHADDFRASERTFQLLTQAAGRAGRGERGGSVVIQTYSPDHYAVITAGRQDYIGFYKQELQYRKLLRYPPAGHLMSVMITDPSEEAAGACALAVTEGIRKEFAAEHPEVIGPADAGLAKVQDIYRKMFYIKHPDLQALYDIRSYIQLESSCQTRIDIW